MPINHVYAVVMAGGVGSRFWPRSRERSPKQFLEIVGNGTMVQNTVARLETMIPPMNTFVVTNKLQQELIYQQLPFIPKENILVEPVGRNTAPCIGWAASCIKQIDRHGIMLVLPADHLIANNAEFLRILGVAVNIAEQTDALLTIGIKPSHPETGFGYIQFDDSNERNPHAAAGAYPVKTFAEKPNLETAEKFLASGDFLWNSGMFVWKAATILQEIHTHLPDLFDQIQALETNARQPNFKTVLEQTYGMMKSISIDYGVMEKAGHVFVVKGDFGWSDVGSWDEVVRLSQTSGDGNFHRGIVVPKDSRNNYIDAGSKIVATIGVEDLIVVVTDDAVLISRKGKSQDVKEVVDYLRRKQMNEYL